VYASGIYQIFVHTFINVPSLHSFLEIPHVWPDTPNKMNFLKLLLILLMLMYQVYALKNITWSLLRLLNWKRIPRFSYVITISINILHWLLVKVLPNQTFPLAQKINITRCWNFRKGLCNGHSQSKWHSNQYINSIITHAHMS